MFSLICDGKVIKTVGTLTEACAVARMESLNGTDTTYQGNTGRMVSVWSGDIGPIRPGGVSVRGVTKHVTYACGVTVK